MVLLEADGRGRIDLGRFHAFMDRHGGRVLGMMVTNPNTSGIFEDGLREIADRLRSHDALLYMDGANMNAIAGRVDLGALGVDAVHNNLHKTWTVPHGGGGPGDAVVAVGERLLDYLPGRQVVLEGGVFRSRAAPRSIGSFHRHWGNFAHKVRAYTYFRALGGEGVREVSAVATLSARYPLRPAGGVFPTLPEGAEGVPRMHEFIMTLGEETFRGLEAAGIPRAQAVPAVGKLFLDFGLHAPTVAFPERYGLMIEPTESFSKGELDRFAGVVEAIRGILDEDPRALAGAPHFTPVRRIDEAAANRNLVLSGPLDDLEVPANRIPPGELGRMPLSEVRGAIAESEAGGRLTGGSAASR